jgi:hypothetical protein
MKPDGRTITPESQRRLRQFNWADYRLYDYYKNKLNREGGRELKHFFQRDISKKNRR